MQPQGDKWLALPQPIHPPAINPELEELEALPRSIECLRHFILSTEYWLSPNGRLRWWLRINFFLTALLLVPAVLLMPVISLVLHEVDGWLSLLVSIVWKLIVLSALVLLVMLLVKQRKHSPSSSKDSSQRR